ncbi:MAG: mechanosensitive ion channel family protein, partial [Spirochaetota bacterium]
FLSINVGDRPLSLWLTGLAWVLGGFVVGKLVAWLSANVLKRLAAKTSTRIDDIVLAFIEKPLVFIVTIAGFRFGADAVDLNPTVDAWVDKLWFVLVAIAAAWAVARVLDAIIEEYLIPFAEKTEGTLDDQLLPILRKGLKLVVWIVALLIALKNAGYDVGALLAGLGIGGVAVALAAKDTLSNFFGSVAVFIDRPFRINDRIKVSGFDGNVVEIGIRTSRLKTLDGRTVTMPNAIFAASPIENVSSEPSTKLVATLDLAHGAGAAGTERAIAAIKAALEGLPGLDGGSLVGLTSIGEAGIRLSYIFFVKKGVPYLDTVSATHLAALRAVEAEGLVLAAPARVSLIGAQK